MKLPYWLRRILLSVGYSYWWKTLDHPFDVHQVVYQWSSFKQALFRHHLYKTAKRYYRQRAPLSTITTTWDNDIREAVSIYTYEEDIAHLLEAMEQRVALNDHLEVVYTFTWITGRFNLLGRMVYDMLEASKFAHDVLSTSKYTGGNI